MAYIYKIEVGACLYIGSTTDMRRRQVQHNSSIQCGDECPIYTYCRENGINKLELIELEYVDIDDRYVVEQYYIDEYKTGHKLLNGISAKHDKKEYMKVYSKSHYQANKDIMKAYSKSYYQANKEKLKEHMKEYHKAYREANKEKLINKNKAYHEANKDKIKERKKANKALTHLPEPQEPSA